jgi:superfamily II DNA or RNA helicase
MDITLRRSGNILEVDPWVPSLEHMLSFRRVIHKFGIGKAKMEFLNEKLYNIEGTPTGDKGQVPGGLFSKVYKELVKYHKVKVEDYRDMASIMPVPDFTRIALLRSGQDKIMLAVAGNDGGLIVGGTGAGKSFCITQICMMYPTLKILILSPRISVVNTIFDSLSKVMPATAIARIGGGKHDKGKRRVTISTTKSILKCDLANCDLLLFDEAHNVGCNQIAEHLAYATRARKFGFTATPSGRSDGSDIIMEAVFGPRVAEIPYDEAVVAGLVTPIEVRVVTVPTAAYIPDSDSPIAKKRWNYWRNASRNAVIARTADTVPDDEQVLIMVETLEHALYLKKLLPKFSLVHYGSVDKDRAKRLGVTKESVTLSRDELDKY